MKKHALVAVFLLLTSIGARAQIVKTVVSGTITDANGVPYAGGTIDATLTPAGISPTVNGQPIGGYQPAISLDTNGHFTMQLFCNSAGGGCSPISPGSTQWMFRVTNPGAQPPVGFGSISFFLSITISGATQDVSGALTAAAPLLYRDNSAGGSLSGSGASPDYACWTGTTSLGNCAVQITGTPPPGYIPIATNGTTAPWTFPPFENIFNIQAYGAVGDGSHLAADTAGITNAFNACSAAGGTAWVPHGTYQFDNSAGPLALTAFNCTIAGEGKTSSIAFNTLLNDGIDITNGCNFNIQGVAWSYSPTVTARSGGYPINIDQTASTCRAIIQNNYFSNGNRSGIRIGNTNNVLFAGNVVSGFLANGAFTVNNNHLKMAQNHYENNQDAAEEFSFYDSGSQASCQDIVSVGMSSTNDLSGVLIDSCKNVTVTGFNIAGAAHEAIIVDQDPTTTTVQFPDAIVISNGTATDTGYGTNPLNRNTAQCIYINIAGAPATFQNISLSNITCKHTAGHGLELGDSGTVNLTWSNLTLDDAGNGNTSTTGECIFVDGNIVHGDNTLAKNCGTYALRNHLTNYGDYTGFFAQNPNQLGAATNGILNESNGGLFVMKGVTRNDTWTGSSRSGISSTASSGVQSIIGLTDICFPVACPQPVFGNSSPITSVGGSVTVSVLVGNLGSAAANKGAYRTVSDSTTITAEGQTCVGSGTATALAFSNGTVWKCF